MPQPGRSLGAVGQSRSLNRVWAMAHSLSEFHHGGTEMSFRKNVGLIFWASALFSKYGYDETTVRMIARRAGVAHGTVLLYARDKRDLVLLIFNHEIPRTLDRATRPGPPGRCRGLLPRAGHAAAPTAGPRCPRRSRPSAR